MLDTAQDVELGILVVQQKYTEGGVARPLESKSTIGTGAQLSELARCAMNQELISHPRYEPEI